MDFLLRLISGVLSVYMLILFIRILLTWFSGASFGRPQELLVKVTDPYLNIFRRIRFLRTDRVDFSPIAAIVSLVIVTNIFNALRITGTLTVSYVLSLIVSAVWSAAIFILGFFIVLAVVRFLSVLFGGTSYNPFWQTLDLMINPVLAYLQRTVFRGRQMSYRNGLGLGILVLIGVAIVARIVINLLLQLLQRIPF